MASILERPRSSVARIGPDDNGRRMSLERFNTAVGVEGYFYELGKGVIEVSGIPLPPHAKQVQAVRNQLVVYQESNPGVIDLVAGGNESKVLVGSYESERHPDLSVYLDPPPETDVWSLWVPEIVVEIVSPRSSQRDYHDKPDEYLAFGVGEYWIVDAAKQKMTVLTRRGGQWQTKVYKPAQKYATRRLPGLSLDLKRILSAR